MTNPLRCAAFALALFGISPATAAPDSAPPAAPSKKVLFFSKSSGHEHDPIKRRAGNPSFAEQLLREWGSQHGIEFTFSKDGSAFNAEYVAGFDAFLFYTSGDLLLLRNGEKGDDNPPMSPEGKAALLQAIESGKGFVGVHSATDTFHSPGNKDHGPARFQPDGERTDPYLQMLGAEFIKHDAQQKARQRIVDRGFPGMKDLPADWLLHEEWYSLKNFQPDLHVLLVLETQGMQGPSYARPAFPVTWARMHGKGRVFYTALGHREDVWLNPHFQAILLGGLNWALRRVDADVSPNIAVVTPEATTLPKYVEPPPPKSSNKAKAADASTK